MEFKRHYFDKVIEIIIGYKIILMFAGNLWEIKNQINKLNEGSQKNRFLKAYEILLNRKASWIGYKSQFEEEPFLPHGLFGIFISHGAKIGKNCTIFQHVTIGSNKLSDSKGKGAPVIGSNCYIGAGAKIIGNVIIGDNCKIGANCVVVKNMPDSSVAVMQPSRIIIKDVK